MKITVKSQPKVQSTAVPVGTKFAFMVDRKTKRHRAYRVTEIHHGE